MYIGLLTLITLWMISRLTDAFSCSMLAYRIRKNQIQQDLILEPAYMMFLAIAVDAVVTALIIVTIIPYLALAWSPPPVWSLPWLGCLVVSSTSFKTYTKFKVAVKLLKG